MEWVKGTMETTQQVYVSLPAFLFTKFKDRVQNFNILGQKQGARSDDILKAPLAS